MSRCWLILIFLLLATAATAGAPAPGTVFRDCDDCPEMVVIPNGVFRMGDATGKGAYSERPPHEVTIRAPFAIGRTEVTFAEYDACVAAGGCPHRPDDKNWGRGRHPVSDVNWHDAQAYAAWLSEKTSAHYRLPTEAEWEYAARAGTTTTYPWGDTLGHGNAICLRCDSGPAFGRTVAELPPNAWGLHDMIGSLREWVEDAWSASFEGAPADGSAWLAGDPAVRATRGGSYYDRARYLTSSSRGGSTAKNRNPKIGFRVARNL